MTDAPRIPEERLSFDARDASAQAGAGGCDWLIGTGQTDDADLRAGTLPRFGDLKQTGANRWTVQEG